MSVATSTAIAIGGIAAAGAGVAGGVLAKKGADKQAEAATQASQSANATELQMYNQNRADLAPWRNAGGGAISTLAQLVAPPGGYQTGQAGGQPGGPQMSRGIPVGGGNFNNFSGAPGRRDAYGGGQTMSFNAMPARSGVNGQSMRVNATTGQPVAGANPGTPAGSLWNDFSAKDFQQDPGYDFRLSEGAKALERSASAKGSLFSGGTLKDLTKYNQDFASNEYQNAYNRFQTNRTTRYNQLAGVAGVGQQAAGQTAALGANTANQVGQNTIAGLTGAAAARASGYNALGGAINGGIGGAQNWYLLSQLMNGGGRGPTTGGV